MKIHFCDLCNESVPQSELDGGRAFMRKGRVVCVKCDQLMTQREASSGDANSGGFASSPSAVRAEAEHAFAPVAALPVVTEVPGSSSMHAAHHPHAPARQTASSSSGVVVGLFAMGLTALSFYWLTERSDKIGATVETRMKELEKTQADAATRAVGR
ncbi:MAG TPA: hypothetical protein VM509_08185, partial [Planctomycetota bacterium]|nr:hypothetical protein [Planctomycetota bacterium]